MSYWIGGAVALTATTLTAPLVRRILIAHDVLDRPNARSSHLLPTPRGGGIACGLGLLSGALVVHARGGQVFWQAITAALLIGIVGLIDDRLELPAIPRLIAQVLTGASLGGVVAGIPGAIAGGLIAPITVNVVNFMDGINGITATTVTLWAATATMAGLNYNHHGLTTLGILTGAIALGFLPWNAPHARLFLGDAGSYLFGGLITSGLLLGASSGLPLILLVAPLTVYIFDVFITLTRRIVRRSPILSAHREHIYQQLSPSPAAHLQTTALVAVSTIIITASTLAPGPVPYVITGSVLTTYALLPKLRNRHHPPSIDDTEPRAGMP